MLLVYDLHWIGHGPEPSAGSEGLAALSSAFLEYERSILGGVWKLLAAFDHSLHGKIRGGSFSMTGIDAKNVRRLLAAAKMVYSGEIQMTICSLERNGELVRWSIT